ncbi:iron-containing alcohol dehydrogenase [Bradyrhizobium sp. LHD-71]|uniref:iron-containing alcohol dehydrogenase n=1 Tax=Bradyrhizobium sp. LHD-71 TaxID=3072141 RepID=UPI00280CB189|nr:iron-containing alcohol dehydrogenase [Bradyrhizobium sp. LHD-71]MDQ8727184.1 iron-containing alcohol dehydrogenase [Bradyrhizobium sp. LHD-71]
MMQGVYEYFPLERVNFGEPVETALKRELDRLGARRVFVLASNTLSRKTGALERIKAMLGDRYVGVFDTMPAHSPRSALLKALESARAVEPDLLLSLGGGSSIDGAKLVQVGLAEGIATHEDFNAHHAQRGADGNIFVPAIKDTGLRQIAIPTTLSGAEYTTTGGSVDDVAHKKDLYIAPQLAPVSIILDPSITRLTTEWLWLSTGFRAVDHAVESICSPTANPFTDATCIHGLRMLQRSMRRTRKDPEDAAARLESQMGVWLATSGMGRGQHGASHGISYSLAAIADVPHGHCSCVLLPATMRFNSAMNEHRQAIVSEALERPGQPAADALLDLLEELGLPRRLRDVGVKREQLEPIARTVVASGQARFNPRPIRDESDVMQILETAW